jgi:hypothetical protein
MRGIDIRDERDTPDAPAQNSAAEHVSSVERSSAFRPCERGAPDRLVRIRAKEPIQLRRHMRQGEDTRLNMQRR